MKSGVYLISSKDGKHNYVGATKCLWKRYINHLNLMRADECGGKMREYVRDNGYEHLTMTSLELCAVKNLYEVEFKWIEKLIPNLNTRVMKVNRNLDKYPKSKESKFKNTLRKREDSKVWLKKQITA